MTEITQEDRIAAAREFVRRHGNTLSEHLAVLDDGNPLVQAFARHRIAARERAIEEAATWCETASFPPDGGNPIKMAINMGGKQALTNAATAIRSLNTPPKLKEA